MNSKSEYIIKGVEILVTVVVVIISLTKRPELIPIVSLVTTLIFITLIDFYRLSKNINETKAHLEKLLRKIADVQKSPFELIQILRYGIIKFPSPEVPVIWKKLLWRIERECLATNYTSPDKSWDREYIRRGIAIQKAKIEVENAKISRVFIVKDLDEKKSIEEIMCEQVIAGIQVRWIEIDEIKNDAFMKGFYERTIKDKFNEDERRTLDFVLIDSELVLEIFLDDNRGVKYAKVSFDKEKCDHYREFYQKLFNSANEVKCSKDTIKHT